MSDDELKILGASLYICEGTRLREYENGRKIYSIEFTNTNPRVIYAFMNFFRKIIVPVDSRVKAQLFIYPDLDAEDTLKYWSGVTGIDKARFNKTIVLAAKISRFKHNPLGTIKIRYAHKEHFLKLQDIIDKVFGGVA